MYKVEILIDAMSVLQAIAQERLKAPCEKSFLIHLLWLREMLESRVARIGWADTRDQYADGLTKGAVSRELIQQCAAGSAAVQHALKWIDEVTKPKLLDATSSE